MELDSWRLEMGDVATGERVPVKVSLVESTLGGDDLAHWIDVSVMGQDGIVETATVYVKNGHLAVRWPRGGMEMDGGWVKGARDGHEQ